MLKSVIIESGISRKAWAERLGISASYLSLLESGAKTPSLDLAFRIERETLGAVRAESWTKGGGYGPATEKGAA